MTGWSGLTALPSVCSRFSDGQRLVRFNSNVVGRGKGKGRHGLSNFDWRIEAQQSRLRPERISPRTIEAGGDGISLRDKFRRAAGRQFYDLPRNRGLLHQRSTKLVKGNGRKLLAGAAHNQPTGRNRSSVCRFYTDSGERLHDVELKCVG